MKMGRLAVALAALLAASAAQPSSALPAKQSAHDNHDEWRKLWEDHITWTRMVIIGVFNDLPGTPAYAARLIDNYEDMEDALEPYFGEEAAEEFGELLEDHLLIAVDILNAAKAGDQAALSASLDQWRANAHDLAAMMNELSPRAWPLAEADAMWQEHLDVTLAEAVKHLSRDFKGEVEVWEAVHEGALMMADFISAGITTTFPQRFTGVCGGKR
jgi:hypothetical protein